MGVSLIIICIMDRTLYNCTNSGAQIYLMKYINKYLWLVPAIILD